MRCTPSHLAVLLFFLWTTGATAATCDVEGALRQLESDVVGELDAVQRRDARQILLAMCDQTDSADSSEAEDRSSETVSGPFGLELRRADGNSRGHERLKKR